MIPFSQNPIWSSLAPAYKHTAAAVIDISMSMNLKRRDCCYWASTSLPLSLNTTWRAGWCYSSTCWGGGEQWAERDRESGAEGVRGLVEFCQARRPKKSLNSLPAKKASTDMRSPLQNFGSFPGDRRQQPPSLKETSRSCCCYCFWGHRIQQ